jgi:tetratricopeptide (TPR) repeat protein
MYLMDKKGNIKGVIVAILAAAIVIGGIVAFYRYEQRNKDRQLAARIAELSSPRGGPPDTIEGLRAAIAAYEDAIDRYVQAAVQTGTYWKILAIRLTDKGMHREALDALERALLYNTEDATIFYLTGVSAVMVAKASLDPGPGTGQSERDRYFSMAERAFGRSIELDPAYAKPRYDLGLLLMMELDRSADALPHLERYVEMMPKTVDGMIALARAYYMTADYRKAVELYDRIIVTTKDASIKAEAQSNREYILGNMYG